MKRLGTSSLPRSWRIVRGMAEMGTRKNLSDEEAAEFFDWLNQGIERGWVSSPVCATHEGLPITEDEGAEWDEGFDPCSPGLRIWAE